MDCYISQYESGKAGIAAIYRTFSRRDDRFMDVDALYQKGMELWEAAEQLIKQHKIASSEGRSEMVSYQKQAVECWQTAVEQGDARAQHQLGYYYYNYGKNSNKNKKAFEWYSKAAEQGFAPAQYELGFLFFSARNVGLD